MTSHTLDAYLQLIADRDRRRILCYLRDETDGTAKFQDLVDLLADSGSPLDHDHSRDRETIAIRLQHTHLPKLADQGVVEFERRSGAVRYYPDEDVEALLDSLPDKVSVLNS